MKGAFAIWDPFLIRMSYEQAGFLRALVEHMTSIIGRSNRSNGNLDVFQDAVAAWLLHILESHQWRETVGVDQRESMRNMLIRLCVMSSTYTTSMLAQSLLEGAEKKTREDWAQWLGGSVRSIDA